MNVSLQGLKYLLSDFLQKAVDPGIKLNLRLALDCWFHLLAAIQVYLMWNQLLEVINITLNAMTGNQCGENSTRIWSLNSRESVHAHLRRCT